MFLNYNLIIPPPYLSIYTRMELFDFHSLNDSPSKLHPSYQPASWDTAESQGLVSCDQRRYILQQNGVETLLAVCNNSGSGCLRSIKSLVITDSMQLKVLIIDIFISERYHISTEKNILGL